MKKLFFALVIGLVFSLLAITVHNAFLLNDYRIVSSTEKVEILIESGDTGAEIAKKLKANRVIKAEKVFLKIAINDKRANGISPGLHQIDMGISAQSALEQLLDPKRNRGLFGFVEGLRKSEILDLLSKSKLVTGKYSANTKIDPLYKTKDVEGFLFPAQYSIIPGATFDEAVDQMVQRFYVSGLEVYTSIRKRVQSK